MMGHTPNIDRIAKEGMLFTDHYGQPSCTAGRAAFIMGQFTVRTGMTTVGIPGSTRIGRKFLASKLWAPTGAGPFIAAHLKSMAEFPPSQGADTLSLKVALEKAQDLMERPNRAGN